MRVCLAAIAAVFFTASSSAAALYVSNAGDDTGNDCTVSATPCATLGHAVSLIGSFDIINMAVGVYKENVTVVNVAVYIYGGWNEDFTMRVSDDVTELQGGGAPALT